MLFFVSAREVILESRAPILLSISLFHWNCKRRFCSICCTFWVIIGSTGAVAGAGAGAGAGLGDVVCWGWLGCIACELRVWVGPGPGLRARFLGGDDRMVWVWRMWSWSTMLDGLANLIFLLEFRWTSLNQMPPASNLNTLAASPGASWARMSHTKDIRRLRTRFLSQFWKVATTTAPVNSGSTN